LENSLSDSGGARTWKQGPARRPAHGPLPSFAKSRTRLSGVVPCGTGLFRLPHPRCFPMLRLIVSGFVCLALVAGLAPAGDKKAKTKNVSGAFMAFKDGTLTIKVKGKKGEEPKPQDFKVADDTKVTTFDGDNKKEGTAKDAFKDLKEGTPVTVSLGDEDKVAAVQVGQAPKKGKNVAGSFVSYADGVLTIKVKGKKGDEPKPMNFNVAADAKVVTLAGDEKKEGAAKDAFKDAKDTTQITLTTDKTGQVTSVLVGTAPKKKDNK
jgi:hypothetical protein